MKSILLVKSETIYIDGKTYIREIKAEGTVDDSGKFRMTRCVGKMFSRISAGSGAIPEENVA